MIQMLLCDIGKKGSRCLTAEGGGLFPSASLAPGELPGLAGTPLGEDRLQGEAISATCRTPEGLHRGLWWEAHLLIDWTPASASSLSCHILFSAWK